MRILLAILLGAAVGCACGELRNDGPRDAGCGPFTNEQRVEASPRPMVLPPLPPAIAAVCAMLARSR